MGKSKPPKTEKPLILLRQTKAPRIITPNKPKNTMEKKKRKIIFYISSL